MDHIVESSAVEDFDNRPSKKIKCSEPDFLDSDRKLNSDPIPSPASPSIQKLSPIIELEDKQACEIDDDQQLQDDKQIKVDTYDYVPQGKFVIYMYFCVIYPFHCNTDSCIPNFLNCFLNCR